MMVSKSNTISINYCTTCKILTIYQVYIFTLLRTHVSNILDKIVFGASGFQFF